MTKPATPDLLEAIVAGTRRRVALQQAREPIASLERRASARAPARDAFRQALARPGRINVIAECKRRSPSRGVLRCEYDAAVIAAAYESAGAAAISVLTEPTFFDGSTAHLRAVRGTVRLPILRKDFIVDRYQIVEARADGADAVLLIVAALSDEELTTLGREAEALGLAVLVEVHDLAELARASAAGATIVGVNNRNLRTLEVDPRVSDQVAAALPAGIVAVSESGLREAADLARLRAAGYHAFLVGERFMTAEDPGRALRELLGTA